MKDSLRKVMETDVTSMNKDLKEVIASMSWIILLRYCHPLHREEYAKQLYKEGCITRDEAREFIIVT